MNLKFITNNLLTFLLLLLLFVAIQSVVNPLFLVEELHYHYELFDLRGLVKGTLFLTTYLLAIFIFLIIIAIDSFWVFLLALFFIFIFSSMDFFVQLLGISHGMSIDEYRLAMNEVGNYQFLEAYMFTIIKAMFSAFIVVVMLYFIRQKVYKSRVSTRSLLVILLPFLLVYGACYKVNTFKLSSYPAALKIPALALEYERLSTPMKKRLLESSITPQNESKIKNIVWVIDESVTGTYLSINGYEKDTTPFLRTLDKNSTFISNFGVVSSISNCSGQSNLFLRIGMRAKKSDEIKQTMYDMPTIFQYAKRAGYTTWLFDSQTQKDHLQNYLTLYDKESIDHFETLGTDVERDKKDLTFLSKFSKITNDNNANSKNFIVVIKYGSHFPYLTSYNHEHTPFRPVLDVAYGGMNMAHKEEMVNSYLNSLYSSVDLYLKALVEKVNLAQTVVFYTSDHGQNILESEGLTRTHCNSELVVKNEVSVPLFVFTKGAKEHFPVDKNRFYAHIQIFPTTLSLLGYGKLLVDEYGKSLESGFKKSNDRHYILSSSLESKIYE